MNIETRKAIESVATCTAIGGTISFVGYFVLAVWWAGIVDSRVQRELAKHETCYQEYRYNEDDEAHWLHINYCGEQQSVVNP